MMSGQGNINTSVNTADDQRSSAGNGATWGGFGSGAWTVNNSGSGVQPWVILAAIGAALWYLKRKA